MGSLCPKLADVVHEGLPLIKTAFMFSSYGSCSGGGTAGCWAEERSVIVRGTLKRFQTTALLFNCYSNLGDWSKWRQAKTATVRMATVQNGNNWPSQNGDRKNAKSQNGDKKLTQGSNDEKKKYVVGLYILSMYLFAACCCVTDINSLHVLNFHVSK